MELDLPDSPEQWISTIYRNQAEFDVFQELAGVAYQKKRGYFDDPSGTTIGIDEIKLSQGTVWIAEVEFDNAEGMNRYQFSVDCDKEITRAAAYSGYELARIQSLTTWPGDFAFILPIDRITD